MNRGEISTALLSSKRFAETIDLFEESGHDVPISVGATADGVDDFWLDERKVRRRVPTELGLSIADRKFLRAMNTDVAPECGVKCH